MAKTKFTVSLGNIKLSQKDFKKIMNAVHKTVNKELKSIPAPKIKKKPSGRTKAKTRSLTVPAAVVNAVATVEAIFTNTDPGLSLLNAKHKGVVQTLTQTGILAFNNVSSGDTISIQGLSLGNSDISVDLTASPQEQKLPPGTFNFNFIIL